MSLARDYARQAAWRDWATAYSLLPPVVGKRILDFGCAIGDQAAALAGRGALVTGVDQNEDLLRVARGREIPDAEFRNALPEGVVFDGIWCSFAAAYLPDLTATLREWRAVLVPGGFVALVEVDDLFAHEPLAPRTVSVLTAFADSGPKRGYDFRRGGALRESLEAAGYAVTVETTLADRELSFEGAADPTVLEAWQSRFDRLGGLHKFAGDEYPAIARDFLDALARPDHRSLTRVRMAIGVSSAA